MCRGTASCSTRHAHISAAHRLAAAAPTRSHAGRPKAQSPSCYYRLSNLRPGCGAACAGGTHLPLRGVLRVGIADGALHNLDGGEQGVHAARHDRLGRAAAPRDGNAADACGSGEETGRDGGVVQASHDGWRARVGGRRRLWLNVKCVARNATAVPTMQAAHLCPQTPAAAPA